ncbi:hypothetical protein D8M04_00670 [Oceanobacillus piezotolerans]|uniref:DNA-binding protein n=2 Tax=Oceanobacillus piezotolerans TaxID=2448030 RepID=A0A498DG44_9BACI|nr:hypothetical protein D8M04_00670 [Oceanobacillus piezotolerans]
MTLADVRVDLDEKQLRDYINKKMDEQLHQVYWTIDINKFSELTGMSKSTLENVILQDPRIKQYERKKDRSKRYWLYEQTMEAYLNILDEWE